MTRDTPRTKSGTCICDWEECAKWTKILKASTTTHKELGALACFKLESSKGSESNDSKIKDKKLMFEKYLKIMCHHLRISYKCVSDKTQVWVAKHHFPWEPIKENKMRYFRNPISEENAKKYGIGVFPHQRNIAIKTAKEQKYFFVPNTPKNTVKQLAGELADGNLNDRAARVQSRLQIAHTTTRMTTITENGQNMVSPQANSMQVSSIDDYIAPVSNLKRMMEFIVDSQLSEISDDNPYDFDKFNHSLYANVHYRNISKLLQDFHGCTGSVFVKKDSDMAVYYCNGHGDKCMKTVFYKKLKRDNVPLCPECKKVKRNDMRRMKRKRKALDECSNHGSKV